MFVAYDKTMSVSPGFFRSPWLQAGGVLTLLLALATQRDQTVRDYLIEKHAVQATRLVACEPAIDNKEEAAPLLIC